MFFNKYVHELITIDTDFIDGRFNYVPPLRNLSVNVVCKSNDYFVARVTQNT